MNEQSLGIYDQFKEWMQKNAPKVDFNRISKTYRVIEEFCVKFKILEKPLFETTDFIIIKKVKKTVVQNKVFRIQNKKIYNESVIAIEWYFAYIKMLSENRVMFDDKKDKEDEKAIGIDIQSELVMSATFEDNFKEWLLQEGVAEKTCKSYISAIHTAERFARNNDIDGIRLINVTFESALASILKLMSEEEFRRLNEGQHNRFSGAFQKLKRYIEYVLNDKNIYDGFFYENEIEKKRVKKDYTNMIKLNSKIEELLKCEKEGITKEEILKINDSYSARQINMALENCHAVQILKKYYHRDNICDYEEMANVLLEVLNKQFESNDDYTSAKQLYNEAKIRLDDFFFYNGGFDSKAEIYDLASHLFAQEKYEGNSFIFLNNMHIWKKEPDYPKDFHGLMIKYAREHNNIFTRDEGVDYFEWIGSATPAQTFSYMIYNTGSQSFLQYDENSFVLMEALNIDESFLDDLKIQLSNLLGDDDYASFGEIDDYFYTTLPRVPVNIYWTPLLLEDILRICDLEYFTVEAGKDNDKKTIPAALIKRNSPYRTFNDVVWAEISKGYTLPKEFSAEEFREFLLDKGFIRGTEKMWNVHKTVAGDIRFFWTNNKSKVTIN